MGTRHLILVYYKGKYHIAQYGQWDGHPRGQGVTVLGFVRSPENLSKLRAVLDRADTMLFTPTKEQLKEYAAEIEHALKERRDYEASLTDEEWEDSSTVWDDASASEAESDDDEAAPEDDDAQPNSRPSTPPRTGSR